MWQSRCKRPHVRQACGWRAAYMFTGPPQSGVKPISSHVCEFFSTTRCLFCMSVGHIIVHTCAHRVMSRHLRLVMWVRHKNGGQDPKIGTHQKCQLSCRFSPYKHHTNWHIGHENDRALQAQSNSTTTHSVSTRATARKTWKTWPKNELFRCFFIVFRQVHRLRGK